MNKWRQQAIDVITAAIAEARRQGLDDDALVKFVNAAYPFGARKNHPYREWLIARRKLLGGIGGIRKPGTAGELARLAEWNRKMAA